MSSSCHGFVVLFALSAMAAAAPQKATTASSAPPTSSRISLHDGWSLQSSCKISATGEQISAPGFNAQGWHKATVPTTVVAALVADKTFPDPYYGMNLKSFPGMDYSSKEFFANQPMPEDSPFRCSWWYRTDFRLPAAGKQATWLHLDGVNYRANVWVNGKKVADAKDVAGTFRIFEFDVSKLVHAGANGLAIEVSAPTEHDLAITWVDWNPTPPDKDMGLWKDVYLTHSGPVALRHPFVTSKLGDGNKSAALTVSADLHNDTDAPVKGELRAEVAGIRASQQVEVPAGEWKTVTFTPEQFSQLNIKGPKLWWPYQMGEPYLYDAKFSFAIGGKVSDAANFKFGVREITSELTEKGYRLFKINGRNILVRGGGWSSDMLLRLSPERIRKEMEYTKDMGLNTIRQEGKLERDEFYDMADRMGILLMPGWCCCDMWEHWKEWTAETNRIAGDSLKDQVYRLRNHPSILVWLYGSDNPPPAEVETMYRKILTDEHWPNPAISSASQTPTSVTGNSGVKMTGPYDYVPPNYWLTDKEAGGAYGFNTETSPGPAIPPLESLKKFIPEKHLWPIDEYWNYHAGGERFTTINIFTKGLEERYGKPADLSDFLRKSQAMAYEGERAMFEAYARNKYNSTGVIQWMLNNGWPSTIWHLFDYYLVPAGGYFGTKKACEMLHVQYSYDDDSVAVINGFNHAVNGVTATAQIYDVNSVLKDSRTAKLDLAADSSTKAFDLPKVQGITTTYFLRLQLKDSDGKLVSENFYWLSTKPDVMNFAGRTDTDYTPQASFEDVTALNNLPQVKLVVHERRETRDGDNIVHVSVQNPGKTLAFMVALRLTQGQGGDDVVPIFWEDNYFSLLPGESREVSGRYEVANAKGAASVLQVGGWNITPATVRAEAAQANKK